MANFKDSLAGVELGTVLLEGASVCVIQTMSAFSFVQRGGLLTKCTYSAW